MCSLVFIVGLVSIFGIINTDKVSPRPSLKSFRDDYDSVAKTCVAVGYVKDHCKKNHDRKNTVIAFNAKAKGTVQSVSDGNIVMFGEVDLNVGGGYNAVKGTFTAPKSGVYVFDWTTMTNNNKIAYTSLVLNGKRRAYNHCNNNSHHINMSCSKMAVVRMEAGVKAWIDSFSGASSVYPKYSSFSGYML
ncbi:complement C1q tumor necrosis factor-related protein 3-like [Saccostrea cucullata]|uniref:complement C1q tumor necrosis factor-related protein 3-like n=1 Tax=Saccostrea cuccullata TaxID=36930 RepID=UPI002ED021D8